MNTTEVKRYGLHHTFDVDLANELKSIDLAVLVHHFQFWIRLNSASGRNFYEERTWMFQSLKDIAASFPYWSVDQVKRFIVKLVELKILKKGNFNKSTYDRTVWYSFENEERFAIGRNRQMDSTESPNPKDECAEPIPDTKPDAIQDSFNTPPTPKGDAAKAADVSLESKKLTEEIIEVLRKAKPTCEIPAKKTSWYQAAQKLLDRKIEKKMILDVLKWTLNDNTKQGTWTGWASKIWAKKNKIEYLNEKFDSLHEQMLTKPEKRGFLPCSDDDLALEEYRSCGEVVE